MIIIYLTNGNTIYIKNCDFDDFITLKDKMDCWWIRNISCHRMWLRKKNVHSFELVDAPKEGQTI
jgi:hypothetical protein